MKKLISLFITISLLLSTTISAEPYKCNGKKVVSVDEYNTVAKQYNGCRELLIKQDNELERARIMIGDLQKERNKTAMKWGLIGAGTALVITASIILSVTLSGSLGNSKNSGFSLNFGR